MTERHLHPVDDVMPAKVKTIQLHTDGRPHKPM